MDHLAVRADRKRGLGGEVVRAFECGLPEMPGDVASGYAHLPVNEEAPISGLLQGLVDGLVVGQGDGTPEEGDPVT